jgi:hypothetical protein
MAKNVKILPIPVLATFWQREKNGRAVHRINHNQYKIVMPYKEISATVTDANIQTIKDAIAAIEAVLPFLLTLTDEERKALFKVGPERLSFVQNAGQAAQDNPNILPQTFDTAGFESAVALFTTLTEINTLIKQLSSKIDDTRMDVGVQAMDGASDVYSYVKTAAAKTPGLKPVAEQLGQLYQKAVAARKANANAKAALAAAKSAKAGG